MDRIKKAFDEAWKVIKMPPGDVMYMAEVETRNYSWKGFGDTPEHAIAALRGKWERYRQDLAASGEDISMMYSTDEFMENVYVSKVISGMATMDNEYSRATDEKGEYVQDPRGSGYGYKPDLTELIDVPEEDSSW